jgi:DNA-binding response OmpR family regulator
MDAQNISATALPLLLIIDDEPLLLRLLQVGLPAYGFRVQTAATAGEALTWLCEHPEEHPLVLVGLQAPGLAGLDIVTDLRQVRPHLCYCLMSGVQLEPDQLQEAGITCLIPKPFDFAELAQTLRGLWRARQSKPPDG